jgi:hypothetical protein
MPLLVAGARAVCAAPLAHLRCAAWIMAGARGVLKARCPSAGAAMRVANREREARGSASAFFFGAAKGESACTREVGHTHTRVCRSRYHELVVGSV